MADHAYRAVTRCLTQAGAYYVRVVGNAQAGAPDLAACYRGVSLWIELKAPADRTTRIQRHRHQAIRDAGGRVVVARHAGDVDRELAAIDRALASGTVPTLAAGKASQPTEGDR